MKLFECTLLGGYRKDLLYCPNWAIRSHLTISLNHHCKDVHEAAGLLLYSSVQATWRALETPKSNCLFISGIYVMQSVLPIRKDNAGHHYPSVIGCFGHCHFSRGVMSGYRTIFTTITHCCGSLCWGFGTPKILFTSFQRYLLFPLAGRYTFHCKTGRRFQTRRDSRPVLPNRSCPG